mmetsp:Transcript_12891/g.28475  ORF Transcript_12891/g.28475 Transcript_12891/m.28475 type:complete len:249 (+) Transcript_12891:127-873(+)
MYGGLVFLDRGNERLYYHGEESTVTFEGPRPISHSDDLLTAPRRCPLLLGSHDDEPQLFIRPIALLVHPVQAVDSLPHMRFGIVDVLVVLPILLRGLLLLLWFFLAVVVVRHVGRCHNQVFGVQGEPMGAHVLLVLFQQYRSAGDEAPGIVRSDGHGDVFARVIVGPILFPKIQFAVAERVLHVFAQDAVERRSQYAGSGGVEHIVSMREGRVGVRAEHVVIIDGRETVADVVDHELDRLGEEGVSRR